jgi:hypothetical protein
MDMLDHNNAGAFESLQTDFVQGVLKLEASSTSFTSFISHILCDILLVFFLLNMIASVACFSLHLLSSQPALVALLISSAQYTNCPPYQYSAILSLDAMSLRPVDKHFSPQQP